MFRKQPKIINCHFYRELGNNNLYSEPKTRSLEGKIIALKLCLTYKHVEGTNSLEMNAFLRKVPSFIHIDTKL